MNASVHKGLKRIPLHAIAFAGPVGTTAYLLASLHVRHYLALPLLWGCGAAVLKELIEQVTVCQVWSEFWIDVVAQAGGSLLGILAMWWSLS